MFEAQLSHQMHDVKASIELRESSGAIQVRPAQQYADDPNGTWDDPVPFGADYTSAEGVTRADAFTHVPSIGDRKSYVRLGIIAVNSSGSSVEFARISMRCDVESRIPDIDGEIRLAGFTTWDSVAPRRSVTADRLNNYTTSATDLYQVIGVYLPMPTDSGTAKMGAFVTHSLDSAGKYLQNTYALSGNETTPDPFEFVVFLGFDSAHTNTKTADIIVKMVAFELYE